MYCGGCVHDNALVTALRQLGHDTLMLPLYLPLTLDEPDQSASMPVFFGGISVYLEQYAAPFRRMPRWIRRLLAARPLLKWAAGRAAKTRADQAGALTLSMLRGEAGHQAGDLDDLVGWLEAHFKPDVICLSNALLAGMARRLGTALHAPVVTLLQGEDSFLDGLPEPHRQAAWTLLRERAADVAAWIAPSQYYARRMAGRLALPDPKVHVVPNGIPLDGYRPRHASDRAPVIGYFARMCPEKGLDTLVDAFLRVKRQPELGHCRLHVGGGCGPGDAPFVRRLRERLAAAGAAPHTRFLPNADRAGKLRFYGELTVFSVPALYGEAFGLYVIEALAAGVPVVQPRHAAFPEILAATGGGVLCEPGDADALAEALSSLLRDPARADELGRNGQRIVREQFTAERMARDVLRVCETACQAARSG
ncbi:MAG: glycosyltransferase family 4 protein [Verrucomicrobia bacterium]|nr:glycosyltransferase family 4 protein [Verrucomicrobiota bacterium]